MILQSYFLQKPQTVTYVTTSKIIYDDQQQAVTTNDGYAPL
jgi:hypothetical protein